MKRSRVAIWILVGVALAAGVSGIIAMTRNRSSNNTDAIPLVEVKRGDFATEVYAKAELSTTDSVMLSAPTVGGDALQITHLAQTGDSVKKGDVVIEFDPSEQHYKLEQNHSELMQAEQEITKAKADALVLAAQDKVALLKARYDLRRAELDVGKNELLSKIDGEKNELALQHAGRVLAELENDIESHHASGKASIFLAQEKSNKAKLAMEQAQENLDRMRVTAPMDGLMSIQKNQNASGGFFFTGMSLPDYRPGDQVQPGSLIVQVLNPDSMNLTATVQEDQHDNVKEGASVTVNFDALPEKSFQGSVKTVGGMAMQSPFEGMTNHGFSVTIQLSGADPRLRPGLTADVKFQGSHQAGVLSIPRQALFMKDGKQIVYVKKGTSYQQQEVKIDGESESRVIIEGVPEGTSIALLDPTAPRKSSASGSLASETQGAP
jgi:HlyD family secretion protein